MLTQSYCSRVYDNELNSVVVKEEEDDALSLPGQDTEIETEGQTSYCSGSMMNMTGGEEHVLDNGDATGINVKIQFVTYLLGLSGNF
jgi:hypothetical protein